MGFASDCVPAAQSESEKYLRNVWLVKRRMTRIFRKILSCHPVQSSGKSRLGGPSLRHNFQSAPDRR
jgi:hypothetical protein